MLNAWTVWWNADRLKHGLADYWNAPIFAPERGAFAFSEPQPATWIVAPIVWLTESPVPAYHVYLMLTLVLNAVFAVRLLRTLRTGWFAATAGGVAMLLHPLVHRYSDVLQLMPLWGALWTLDALLRLQRRPSRRLGVELGIAVASVFTTSVHHGLFLTLLLGVTVWFTVPRRRWRAWLRGSAFAAVTAGLMLAPLLWPMYRILRQHHFGRPRETVQSLSATPAEWLQVPSTAIIRIEGQAAEVTRPLSPGWLRIAWAGAALLLCWRTGRRRRACVFLAAFACLAFLCSFGVNLRFGTWSPWLVLSDWVPGFSLVRSANRFAYFVQLAVILMAALGLDAAIGAGWARFSRPRVRWVLGIVLGVCGLAIAWEVPPPPVTLVVVPDASWINHGWPTCENGPRRGIR